MVVKLEDAVNKYGWGKGKVKVISLSGWVIMNEDKMLFASINGKSPLVWPTKKAAQMIEQMNLTNCKYI